MKYLTQICGRMTKSGGVPCRRPTIRGGTACSVHGGNSPLARMAARENIAIAGNMACEYLRDLIKSALETTCEACGRPTADPSPIIRAAQVVLDRSGFHPSVAVQVSHEPTIPPWAEFLTDDQLQQIGQWIDEAKRRMSALPAIEADAVLVDDDDAQQVADEIAVLSRELADAERELAEAEQELAKG